MSSTFFVITNSHLRKIIKKEYLKLRRFFFEKKTKKKKHFLEVIIFRNYEKVDDIPSSFKLSFKQKVRSRKRGLKMSRRPKAAFLFLGSKSSRLQQQ